MNTLTDKVVVAIAAIAVLYDAVAVLAGQPTISRTIKAWAGTDDLWVLPLAWAALFGHFFIPGPHLGGMEWRTVAVLGLFVGCVVLNATRVPTLPLWSSASAGLILGGVLWSQG
jgi:hypothetical protein